MRIGIAHDTAACVEVMRGILTFRHQIAWVAHTGMEAVAHCASNPPDMILMGLIMPGMDGVEATRQIMTKTPCPILILDSTEDHNSAKAFEAIGCGALEVTRTPTTSRNGAMDGADALLAKIEFIRRWTRLDAKAKSNTKVPSIAKRSSLVVIGSSAGGPAALAKVLGGLPPDIPAAFIVVQHVDVQFSSGLATWLNTQTRLPVRIATTEDHPTVGSVLLAGTNDHLVFKDSSTLSYTSKPTNCVYRPSIDIFFESVLRHWKGDVIGILLTGMGRDGAKGLKMLRQFGHHTIAQDQATSAVYGMPKAAAEIDAAVEVLPMEKIAQAVLKRMLRCQPR